MPPRELKPAELDALWTDLAKDADKAHIAMRTFTADPKRAVLFLGEKVQPVKAIPADRLASLLKALGTEKLNERTQATAELENIGDLAEEAMKKAPQFATILNAAEGRLKTKIAGAKPKA